MSARMLAEPYMASRQFADLMGFCLSSAAGLEEYAAPIIKAIDPTGTLISDCLYRPACTRTSHHQCIKDLSNLGRPLSRYDQAVAVIDVCSPITVQAI